jgi:hypothetical protein
MAVVRTGQGLPSTNGKRLTVLPVPAKPSDGSARKVGTFTDTVRTQYSTTQELFTPNWDKLTASEQQMARIRDRTDMGQKYTPKGPGRLRAPRGG